ncbi:sulfotransferase domain-containing protein [Moorena producens]|uniref:sulfotransferase domain-containing protein n=1 Tax=Moorena producens TaxID=1155739 RepID=UPI003C71B05C
MTLPNFLIIGAQKAGTTWLSHNLREHPEVFIPSDEIHYFNKRYNLNQGIEWYKQHFADVNGEKSDWRKKPLITYGSTHYLMPRVKSTMTLSKKFPIPIG